ncbi:MAG: class I SAM-dependent methyltransferase [Puniceicoccaceae bacterium]|nr:MAG: class I SAM-dependent methyltransferase [Puniceicoccaceae bacterium]
MCIACDLPVDAADTNAFGDRYLEILNHGALALMLSIGYRTGLFDAMAGHPPSSSEAIATRAGLNERYVREWLGAMVAGGIVACDAGGAHFALPPAQAELLARSPSSAGFGHFTQYVSMMGEIENRIVTCFQQGGGIPYEAFPRFHEVMAADSRQTVVDALFDHLLPLVPDILPGLDSGIDVLDVGCGRGEALLALAKAYPKSRFTGYDLSVEAIDHATAVAAARGLHNARFQARDLTDFDQSAPAGAFDFVTAFDAIHDQARPDRVLAGIHRTLRPGGTFFMQDIGASSNMAENRDHPLGPLLYGLSCCHCMTVSLAQGGLGLGAMWGEQASRRFLAKAGFTWVERHTLEHDVMNYYYVMRK